jgi:hypothetical protein
MKIGVSTTPCRVLIRPQRAAVSLSRAINSKGLVFIESKRKDGEKFEVKRQK